MRIIDSDGTQLLAPEATSSWDVLYCEVSVRKEKSSESQELGFKKKDTCVRGYAEEDWLRLADEPGYMKIIDTDGTQLLAAQARSRLAVRYSLGAVHVKEH